MSGFGLGLDDDMLDGFGDDDDDDDDDACARNDKGRNSNAET
jgi:hypothetical protein